MRVLNPEAYAIMLSYKLKTPKMFNVTIRITTACMRDTNTYQNIHLKITSNNWKYRHMKFTAFVHFSLLETSNHFCSPTSQIQCVRIDLVLQNGRLAGWKPTNDFCANTLAGNSVIYTDRLLLALSWTMRSKFKCNRNFASRCLSKPWGNDARITMQL